MEPQQQLLNRTATKWNNILLNVFFVGFVMALLFVHVRVFLDLNLYLIDSDQPYMWLGASDYAKGLFYEPRYYAQDYNTFMEGLFAVPLLWLNVPVYYAVPIATHVIFLFPILFSSIYLFFKKKKIQALIFLALILCLPAPYDLMNSIPRGFVTGLFFTSFFIISLLNPNDLRFVFLNTSFAVVGFFVNQNSILVSIPFLFCLFLCNYKTLSYYLVSGVCVLLFIPLHFLFDRFYLDHPDYIINVLRYRFSSEFFFENISRLDTRFGHISFFFENNCLSLLFVLTVLAVFLYLQNKKAFASFCLFISIILLSFCSGKTVEGSSWIFMSFSRMYLGIPLLICLFIPLLTIPIRKFYFLLFLIPIAFSFFKIVKLKESLAWHYNDKNWVGVKLIDLKTAIEASAFYKDVCKKNNSDFLLISNRFWLNNVLAYGGPSMFPDFPKTQETKWEKRYWVRQENKNKVFENFVMISSCFDLDKLVPKNKFFELQRLDDYGLFLVKKNNLNTENFINAVRAFDPNE